MEEIRRIKGASDENKEMVSFANDPKNNLVCEKRFQVPNYLFAKDLVVSRYAKVFSLSISHKHEQLLNKIWTTDVCLLKFTTDVHLNFHLKNDLSL